MQTSSLPGIIPTASTMAKDVVVDIEGRHLKVSNLDKVLYPEAGFTKGQVIDYFVRIAPVLLPHLQGRPLTMLACPTTVRTREGAPAFSESINRFASRK